jgi:hypothetical protein
VVSKVGVLTREKLVSPHAIASALLLKSVTLRFCTTGLLRGDYGLAVQSVVVTEVLKAAARAYGHKMRAGGPCSTQDNKVGGSLSVCSRQRTCEYWDSAHGMHMW